MAEDDKEGKIVGDTDNVVNVSQDLQSLISKNSELGSRLLSLLLVSSSNGKEIIEAINKGQLSLIQSLDMNLDVKVAKEGKGILDEMIKKRKSTEASARFRVRKKQREQEKLNELRELNSKIGDLNRRVDVLLEENRYWKAQLERLNDKRSRELLESIKKRNSSSSASASSSSLRG
ncbi:Met28p TDEL_0H03280 [Torulaspora delbrueckii]|uniref:BZIP domain-containing protein n=1 Tax=Torulaspora delbrueckii TaxID=4950 RepID=G8ZZZ3_TORDE|nr:hypothetical protein TDEL_0H03280 [Torulaspora delbrueckii]CCE94187.1 hypothetical protein TDEL_0H03280 [Torulaspora delbrueckii]